MTVSSLFVRWRGSVGGVWVVSVSAKGNLGGETFICKIRHLIWGRKLVGCRRSVKKGRLLGVFHER